MKDLLSRETDGQFFSDLRKMEREVLKDDPEALAILDEEEKQFEEDEE